MKKLLVVLIVLTILSALLLPCNATEYLTEEEAGELINKAVDLFDYIHLDAPKGTVDMETSIQLAHSIYYYQTDEVITKKDTYYLVVDDSNLPGGSFEALSEYARSVYTEDIADSMYNTSCYSYYESEQPTFYKSESGQIYMLKGIERDWCQVRPYRYGYKYHYTQVTTDVIDIIYVDNEKATVRYLTSIGPEGPRRLVWVECNLVNTENGWRIADSPFTQMLRYERHAWNLWEPTVTPYDSPSTADPAFDLVFILPTVSVAAIASAFCLMRRRRGIVL